MTSQFLQLNFGGERVREHSTEVALPVLEKKRGGERENGIGPPTKNGRTERS